MAVVLFGWVDNAGREVVGNDSRRVKWDQMVKYFKSKAVKFEIYSVDDVKD